MWQPKWKERGYVSVSYYNSKKQKPPLVQPNATSKMNLTTSCTWPTVDMDTFHSLTGTSPLPFSEKRTQQNLPKAGAMARPRPTPELIATPLRRLSPISSPQPRRMHTSPHGKIISITFNFPIDNYVIPSRYWYDNRAILMRYPFLFTQAGILKCKPLCESPEAIDTAPRDFKFHCNAFDRLSRFSIRSEFS